jgi:hypothetical protein
MHRLIKNWAILIVVVGVLTVAVYATNGPSEAEVASARADDLADAQARAQHLAELVRKCHKSRGPSAELMQARGDEYVCREGRIEPTPEAMLHRYALLGGEE